MIKISEFHITSNGDQSVGIFQRVWVFRGGFFFDSKEELEEFKTGLKNTFKIITDDCTIQAIFEIEGE